MYQAGKSETWTRTPHPVPLKFLGEFNFPHPEFWWFSRGLIFRAAELIHIKYMRIVRKMSTMIAKSSQRLIFKQFLSACNLRIKYRAFWRLPKVCFRRNNTETLYFIWCLRIWTCDCTFLTLVPMGALWALWEKLPGNSTLGRLLGLLFLVNLGCFRKKLGYFDEPMRNNYPCFIGRG